MKRAAVIGLFAAAILTSSTLFVAKVLSVNRLAASAPEQFQKLVFSELGFPVSLGQWEPSYWPSPRLIGRNITGSQGGVKISLPEVSISESLLAFSGKGTKQIEMVNPTVDLDSGLTLKDLGNVVLKLAALPESGRAVLTNLRINEKDPETGAEKLVAEGSLDASATGDQSEPYLLKFTGQYLGAETVIDSRIRKTLSGERSLEVQGDMQQLKAERIASLVNWYVPSEFPVTASGTANLSFSTVGAVGSPIAEIQMDLTNANLASEGFFNKRSGERLKLTWKPKFENFADPKGPLTFDLGAIDILELPVRGISGEMVVSSGWDQISLDGKAMTAKIGEVDPGELELKAAFGRDSVRISRYRLDDFGGTIAGELAYDAESSSVRYELRAGNIDFAQIKKALPGSFPFTSGKAKMFGLLSDGKFARVSPSDRVTHSTFDIADLTLDGTDLSVKILEALDTLPGKDGAFTAQLQGGVEGASAKHTTFATVHGRADIQNEILTIPEIRLVSDTFLYDADGTADLNGEIHLSGRTIFTKAFSSPFSMAKLDDVYDGLGRIHVPVNLNGPLADLTVSVLPEEVAEMFEANQALTAPNGVNKMKHGMGGGHGTGQGSGQGPMRRPGSGRKFREMMEFGLK